MKLAISFESCTSQSYLWVARPSLALYAVVDEFDLDREIVTVAMNHIDRFYSSNHTTLVLGNHDVDDEVNNFDDHIQLLSMATLWLAVKVHDGRNIIIPGSKSSMETILKLGRGKFSPEQLRNMEVRVLQRLQWLVHPPTPQFCISYFFSRYSPPPTTATLTQERIDEWKDLATFYVELSILDYCQVPVKPSLLALVAIIVAAEDMDIMAMSGEINVEDILFVVNNNCSFELFHTCKERIISLVASSVRMRADAPRTFSPVSVTQIFK
jgi:hypothetical protein